MKTAKQARREARQLFRLCLVNGSLEEDRARRIVQRLVEAASPATLSVASRFERLVKLDRLEHRADVKSAVVLPPDIRTQIEAGVAQRYGPGIVTTFTEDPALLGGVRVTVGSDVYDGTVKAGLAALAARL
jgi:F-type H+-transporting ATPase subunit delta